MTMIDQFGRQIDQYGRIIPNMQPQMQMNYNRPMQSAVNGIIWVQGIEGAKAYQLPENSNAVLLDSEIDGRFYIKTSDNIGMCNLRMFDYTEVTQATTSQASPSVDMSAYVTRDELNAILSSLGGVHNEQSIPTNDSKPKTKSLITK